MRRLRPGLRLAAHVHVQRLDRAAQRARPLAVEGRPRRVEARERLHDHVDRALRAHRVGPEVRVDERLGPDHPGRRQDRVHQRPELEDARLARAGAARERLRPRVEPEPDREDEAGVREPDHVLRPRLVVVRVEPRREDRAGPRAGRPRRAARGRRAGRRWRPPVRAAGRSACRTRQRARARRPRAPHRRVRKRSILVRADHISSRPPEAATIAPRAATRRRRSPPPSQAGRRHGEGVDGRIGPALGSATQPATSVPRSSRPSGVRGESECRS